jgi:hypothetical protein
MNERERVVTLASLRALYVRLETFRHVEPADLVFPGWQKHYEWTLEDAHTALA